MMPIAQPQGASRARALPIAQPQRALPVRAHCPRARIARARALPARALPARALPARACWCDSLLRALNPRDLIQRPAPPPSPAAGPLARARSVGFCFNNKHILPDVTSIPVRVSRDILF